MRDQVKRAVFDAGFDLVGIAAAEPLHDDFKRYCQWLSQDRAAGMNYLRRNIELRLDPSSLLPGARSVIVAAAAYDPLPSNGPLASYSVLPDYHTLFRSRLEDAARALEIAVPGAAWRVAVDTAPILERAVARRAGIGWVGRSTSLITERYGPFVLLGEIITDVLLDPDPPREVQCKECDACLNACPTGALVAPWVLDARRCISFLTIEKRGDFSDTEEKQLNGWIFGCDLCLKACPHGERSGASAAQRSSPLLEPIPELASAGPAEIRALCNKGFKKNFGKTPIARAGKKGLLRNLDAVMPRNSRDLQ